MNHYKTNVSLSERKRNSSVVLEKYYPNKVPVIIQKLERDKQLPNLEKIKYLIPSDMTYSSLMIYIRNILVKKLPSSTALFLTTESGHMLCSSEPLSKIYIEHSDNDDKFLYLFYCTENTFG